MVIIGAHNTREKRVIIMAANYFSTTDWKTYSDCNIRYNKYYIMYKCKVILIGLADSSGSLVKKSQKLLKTEKIKITVI